jgi:hypothetical protein
MFKKFQIWSSKGLDLLSKQLDNLFAQTTVSGPSQTANKPLAVERASTREVRIPPHERKIMVRCISCRKVHELSAACHVCGAPICENTLHCRKTRIDGGSGMTLIYCPSCYMGR